MKQYYKKKLRGFTLIEIAIVLVVLGLLIGMVFKGKSILDAAKLKTDISKISKISTALNVYYSKYNTLPGIIDNKTREMTSQAIYNQLISEGMLKDSDFKLRSIPNSYWQFHGCEGAYDPSGNLLWQQQKLNADSKVCLYRTDKNPSTQTASILEADKSFTNSFLMCSIENMMDDNAIKKGDGRLLWGGHNAAEISMNHDNPDYYNCSRYENEKRDTNPSNSSSYAFRIF